MNERSKRVEPPVPARAIIYYTPRIIYPFRIRLPFSLHKRVYENVYVALSAAEAVPCVEIVVIIIVVNGFEVTDGPRRKSTSG